MDKRRTVIRAVLESDLEKLLGRGAIDHPTCVVCDRRVPDGEIGGLVKIDGQLRVFCDRATCLVAARRSDWVTPQRPEDVNAP